MSMIIRHQQIVELVRQRGYISIDELAQHFAVTPQTLRRDINQLADAGQLRRYHGGAALDSSVINTEYSQRTGQHLTEKQKIAEKIAQDIPDHASIFINIGTTTEAIAHALLKHQGLKVITNNLNVAGILSAREDFEVLIASGRVRPDGGVIGQATSAFFSQFKADYALIGISGIDEDGTLLDFDFQEVKVSQTIIENSKRVWLAADHSKFGRHAMMRLAQLDAVERVYTDALPEQHFQQIMQHNQVKLVVAD